MKRFLPIFEIACIDYAIIILLNSLSNVLLGYNSTDLWNIEIFAVSLFVIGVWNLISRIDFKHAWSFFTAQGIACLIEFYAAGFFLHWFSWDIVTIIAMGIRFLIIWTVTIFVLRAREKAEAEQINALIANHNS